MESQRAVKREPPQPDAVPKNPFKNEVSRVKVPAGSAHGPWPFAVSVESGGGLVSYAVRSTVDTPAASVREEIARRRQIGEFPPAPPIVPRGPRKHAGGPWPQPAPTPDGPASNPSGGSRAT
jgi:hypothetical protein